jgi:hypothetical protein
MCGISLFSLLWLIPDLHRIAARRHVRNAVCPRVPSELRQYGRRLERGAEPISFPI